MGGHSDDIMALAYHQPSLVVSCSCDGQIIAYAARRMPARSRCRCGSASPSPGADAAAREPRPSADVAAGAPPAACAVRSVRSGQRTRSVHSLMPMEFLFHRTRVRVRARACSGGVFCRRYNLDSGTIKFRMVLPMSYALSSQPLRADARRSMLARVQRAVRKLETRIRCLHVPCFNP